jgi:hypothetical protein
MKKQKTNENKRQKNAIIHLLFHNSNQTRKKDSRDFLHTLQPITTLSLSSPSLHNFPIPNPLFLIHDSAAVHRRAAHTERTCFHQRLKREQRQRHTKGARAFEQQPRAKPIGRGAAAALGAGDD